MDHLRLKDIRKKLNKTQEEFSKYLTYKKGVRISRSTLAKYESGTIYPSKRTLKKLAAALDVSEYYLSGQGHQTEDINESILQLLHTSYFDSNGENETQGLVKQFLSGSLNESHRILDFYYDSNGKKLTFSNNVQYPRTRETDKFWQESFPFLFRDSKFQETLVGTNELEFKDLINKRIKDIYTRLDFSFYLNSISKQLEDLDAYVKDMYSQILDESKNYDTQKSIDFISNAIEEIRNTYYFSGYYSNAKRIPKH